MTGRGTKEIRERLQAYRADIAEIDAMIPDGTYLVHGAGERAREAAKNLKAAVKLDYKRRPTSGIDRNVFSPCMHRVFVALQALKTNTSPGPEWKRALLNADSDLSHWLSRLDE